MKEKYVFREYSNHLMIKKDWDKWVLTDAFVPSTKIVDEGNYSIISDYLGMPVEAYDEKGMVGWTCYLWTSGRIYGWIRFYSIPLSRQYDDVEIGFYYNWFRYYDPEQVNYT